MNLRGPFGILFAPKHHRPKARRKKADGGAGHYGWSLNAEFQRIARRDKKAFLSNQCKEREENNRMGKTRHLFKKITLQKS